MDVSTTITTSVPAGAVLDFAGSSAPIGYLICDGSLVSRTTYARLFEVLSTTWGAGDGSTTFKLPDFRGRALIGSGTGSGLTARTLAATGGEETHLLTTAEMPSHTHTQDPHTHIQNSHAHTIDAQKRSSPAGTGGLYDNLDDNTSGTRPTNSVTAVNQNTTATNQNTGGGGSHNNMQPFVVTNKIIKF